MSRVHFLTCEGQWVFRRPRSVVSHDVRVRRFNARLHHTWRLRSYYRDTDKTCTTTGKKYQPFIFGETSQLLSRWDMFPYVVTVLRRYRHVLQRSRSKNFYIHNMDTFPYLFVLFHLLSLSECIPEINAISENILSFDPPLSYQKNIFRRIYLGTFSTNRNKIYLACDKTIIILYL